MKSLQTAIEVRSIVYDNLDTTVLVNAVTSHNQISHDTQLFISFSELNQVISDLQKLNPDTSLSELFVEEKIAASYTQFTFQATLLENRMISMHSSRLHFPKKEIRA